MAALKVLYGSIQQRQMIPEFWGNVGHEMGKELWNRLS
jgi:hypothetical protein